MRESVIYRSILAEGQAEERRLMAQNLLREGMALEMIMRVTGLSLEQLQQLQENLDSENA